MKGITNCFIVTALLAFCAGCKSKTPEPLLDGTPRVVSIKFPGIPAEDVTIDQKNFVITVKVPPLLPTVFEPEVKVTENAELADMDWRFIFTKSIYFKPGSIYLKGKDSEPSIYTFKLIPAGPLEFIDANSLLEYVIRGGSRTLNLPARNLYANGMLHYVRMTNRETKEVLLLENLHNVTNPVFTLWGETMNQVGIFMNSRNSIPGTYDLEVVTKDEVSTKYPKPFVIRKGAVEPPELGFSERFTPPGNRLGLGGANLFEGDFTLELIDSTDRVTPLRDIEYEKSGYQIWVKIPPSVSYNSHHILRFTYNGGRDIVCGRLHIRDDNYNRLAFVKFGDSGYDCSIKGPVVIKRNKPTEVQILSGSAPLVTDGPTNRRLKIVSVDNQGETYYVPAPVGVEPCCVHLSLPIVIPQEIPGGRYRISVQVLGEKGEVAEEGLPYFRIMEII